MMCDMIRCDEFKAFATYQNDRFKKVGDFEQEKAPAGSRYLRRKKSLKLFTHALF